MKKILCLIWPVLLAVACNSAGPAPSSAEPPRKSVIVLTPEQQATGKIETQAAALSRAPELLRVAGRIALADDKTWHVGVRADGIVIGVYVGLGDRVEKGQLLARYHADEVREARAGYRKALADLNRLQAAQALAQRNYERAQTLQNLKAASVQQVETAKQEVLVAQTAVRGAQVEVDRGKDQLEDDLRVPADPGPDTPEEIADNVPILAPASGYIIQKLITPGKTVQTTNDTFVIGDLSEVWMLANVRQEQLSRLNPGQSATVILAGMPEAKYPGKVTNLGQQLDEVTRLMQVRIVLQNPGNRLKPEMLANAEIPVGDGHSALVVPSDALQQSDNQDVVFVRAPPDRFTVRPVQVGETVGGMTPILSGLQPGEQIAVRGSFVLKSQLLKSTMEE
jgi:cobalt-zinc-cadmium efflux system membrane fusion protein